VELTKEMSNGLAERFKTAGIAYADSQFSTLGGAARPAILIRLSADKKEDWYNNIFQNSRYIHIRIDYAGEVEQFGKSYRIKQKMRTKRGVKTLDEAVEYVLRYWRDKGLSGGRTEAQTRRGESG
jgi:hypothetical protein